MKKLITAIILSIFLAFTITGCGAKTLSYAGAYWHESGSGFVGFNETNVYSVEVVSTKPSNSTELVNEYVSLVIEDGEYTTNLKMLNDETHGNYYAYTTTLKIKGKYVFETQEFAFEDDITTTTLFNSFAKDFSVIRSNRKSNNSTTLLAATSGYEITKASYEFNIEYGSSDAVLTRTIINSLNEESKDTTTIKKYAKSNYVDNELILLMPRAYKYDTPFTDNFNSISGVDKRNLGLYYTTATNNNETTISSFNVSYEHNGVQTTSETLQAIMFRIGLDSTFSGPSIDAYYLIDQKTHRHKMLCAYTALNDSLGYLKYTLVKSTDKTQIN